MYEVCEGVLGRYICVNIMVWWFGMWIMAVYEI